VELAGKRIVIIGGSSGLGLATAKAAVALGAAVVIGGRSRERLEQAQAEIGGEVEAFTLDIAQEDQVRSFFERVEWLDHLATPGNRGVRGPFLELDSAAARAGFDSKFWGQYNAAKYAAPRLSPGGSIVLFAGAFSQRPAKGSATQSAINSAVEGLARALAVELAPLRVNAVSPGLVDTPLHAGMPAKERQAMYAAAAGRLPVGRIGRSEDVAQTVLYLMANGFTTGSTIYVDGGATMR
jgi:NAD(P)-dependent dehydrogenase (short-subunit alcohol dehydrogenase family)